MQLKGIDFFETYAPVVQWTTIRLVFILEVLLGLKSKKGDVTCVFLHSNLEPGETVYVDMPLSFNVKSKKWEAPSVEAEEDSLWTSSESQGVLEIHH